MLTINDGYRTVCEGRRWSLLEHTGTQYPVLLYNILNVVRCPSVATEGQSNGLRLGVREAPVLTDEPMARKRAPSERRTSVCDRRIDQRR